MKSKHICIVGPSLKMGGAERASVNIANGVSRLGQKVTYIAIFNNKPFFELDEKVDYYSPEGFNTTQLSVLKTIIFLRKTIKKANPDTILAFSKFYAALTCTAMLFQKKPIFISERSSPLFNWGTIISLVNSIIFKLKKPTGVIAQTSIALEYQRKYYSNGVTKFKIIPNALRDVEVFNEIKRKNLILAVGRFNDSLKGFDRLIEAYALINGYKGWKLVFAGGDEDGEYLKKQAEELGVLDNLIFLGKVKEIDRVYAEASIFVIPSRSEGFPNALCEAMAAGLPCIAYDFVAGPRDIITDNFDGFIVENGNKAALAKKIKELIDDENMRNTVSRNATNIRNRYNQSKISKSVLDFVLGNDD